MRDTFDEATQDNSAGIALFSHDDLCNPYDRAPGTVPFDGYQSFVDELSALSIRFNRPLMIVSGGSHDIRGDSSADWMSSYYSVETPPKLTQIIVDRAIEDDLVWLRLDIDHLSLTVFSWEEVTVLEQ